MPADMVDSAICRHPAGPSPSAPFSFAGPLTESVLLGCLATRFKDQKLEWDGPSMRVTNLPEANAFVRRTYRKGWEVEGL